MSFWEQLEKKKITSKPEIESYLVKKLGEPQTELHQNLLFELTKKICAYYQPESRQSHTSYSLLGTVSQIAEKRFKEGKRRGQIFYSLQLREGGKLRALQEDLPEEKWQLVQKSALLNQQLVFKYKFWLTNKDILDFSTPEIENQKIE